jgi:dipeptidyl aminopeptidase/acylaminoacyl peptidase
MTPPTRPRSAASAPLRPLLVLPLLVLAAAAGPAVAGPGQGAGAGGEGGDVATLQVPDTIRVSNIPPLPASIADELRPYSHIRSAGFQDWHPAERRILITTRFAEVSQLHEVGMPLGARTQLTFYEERVTDARYRPGAPSQVAFARDEGGAENFQLFLLDRASGRVRRFTDGVHRHQGMLWSRDGGRLAYVGNARNGRDFDLYVEDPAVEGSERRVAELSGQWAALDWSPDDRRLLVSQFVSANESHLFACDLATGALVRLTPPPVEGVRIAYRGGRWSPDGAAVYTTTDRDGEFLRLARLDLASGAWTTLTGGLDWDVEGFDLSDDGALVAFTVNEDGLSKLHLLETSTGAERPVPALPPGVAGDLEFRPGGHELAFAISWARSPQDVWSVDADRGTVERWTASEAGGLNPETFPVPELVRYPTFDEVAPGVRRTIPAFVYRPDPARFPPPWPVYVDIHGGPEGQERPGFQGSQNYLPGELGVAMVFPNVRGSAGYGKSYLVLDNGPRREDSVRDVEALVDWLGAQPDFDPARMMVGGGSYGGYMVLASMTLFGERFRCGFDYVGISNFVTFLENTQGYRQDLRRVEYGDERDPEMRRILEEISPANRADRLKRPLLVAQGANDPRVPLSESDQIVAAVGRRGTPVWYLVAADEGHGFAKKSNADYLRAVWVEFIERCLLEDGFPTTGGSAGTAAGG